MDYNKSNSYIYPIFFSFRHSPDMLKGSFSLSMSSSRVMCGICSSVNFICSSSSFAILLFFPYMVLPNMSQFHYIVSIMFSTVLVLILSHLAIDLFFSLCCFTAIIFLCILSSIAFIVVSPLKYYCTPISLQYKLKSLYIQHTLKPYVNQLNPPKKAPKGFLSLRCFQIKFIYLLIVPLILCLMLLKYFPYLLQYLHRLKFYLYL